MSDLLLYIRQESFFVEVKRKGRREMDIPGREIGSVKTMTQRASWNFKKNVRP